jgi:hypothetical protein
MAGDGNQVPTQLEEKIAAKLFWEILLREMMTVCLQSAVRGS